jgi:hypothetical protein
MPPILAKPVGLRASPQGPMARGMKSFLLANETSGVISTYDSVNKLKMPGASAATVKGGGLYCDASGKGFQVLAPAAVKLAYPITVAARVRVLATPGVEANWFGVLHNSTNASPFDSVRLCPDFSGNLAIYFNVAGTSTSFASSTTSASQVGKTITLVGVLNATSRFLYLDGAQIATQATTLAAPAYSATSQLVAGSFSADARNTASVIEGAGLWNVAFTVQMVKDLTADFFSAWRVPNQALDRLFLAQSTTAAAGAYRPRRRPPGVLGSGVF